MRRTIYETLALAAPAVLGTVAVLYATARWGIGVSPDSTTYFRVARELFRGAGFRDMAGIADGFPPLYPIVLAAVAKLGTGVVGAARWSNAMLFGADVLMVGLLIRRSTGSLYAGLLVSLLALGAVDLLEVHFMAWSEPVFLFCGILELLLLAAFLESSSEPRLLYLSAAAAAAASLDRYPGASFVIAGTLGILCLGNSPAGRRIRHALTFGVLGGLPTAVWILWAARATGPMGGRHAFYFHPIPRVELQSGLQTVQAWLDPGGLSHIFVRHPLAGLAAGLLTIGAGVLGWIRSPGVPRARPEAQRTAFNTVPALATLFIVTYAAFLLFAFWFIQLAELNARLLSPIYVLALILIACLAWRGVRSVGSTPFLRAAACGAYAVLAMSYSVGGARWIAHARGEGLGYAARAWQQSPIIERIKALPAATTIYTNGPDAIYFFTGRIVEALPAKQSNSTGLRNGNYASELTAMRRHVQSANAVLVYFTALPRPEFPSEREMQQVLPLRLLERVSDGAIYAW